MSNEQLMILLISYLERLAIATEHVRASLPPEMITVSKNLFQQDIEAVPALEPIYHLMGEWEKEINYLKPK